MTRSVEMKGKSVAEATAKAIRELGVSRDEAEVEIVKRGKRGFLGLFGTSPATVRVSHRLSTRDRAEEIVSSLLKHMGFSSQLHVTEEKNSLVFDIETAGADGLLIGKGGSTLSAMEYLINRMLQRENRRTVKIALDVSGYKHRREDFLRNKALSLAEQVRSAGKQITMEPLESDDRKIVHNILRSAKGVVTKSVGSGRSKSIVIAPSKSKGKGRSGRSRSRGRGRKK